MRKILLSFLLIPFLASIVTTCSLAPVDPLAHTNPDDPSYEGNKAITAFSFADLSVTGVINEDEKTVTVLLAHGTDPNGLVPTITHNGVSISPASGVAQDFTSPVTYVVRAEDETMEQYTVTVYVAAAITVTVDQSLAITSGLSEQLAATVADEFGGNLDLTWSSANTEIATVDEGGTVTGAALGSTDITVTGSVEGMTEDSMSASCRVYVLARGVADTGFNTTGSVSDTGYDGSGLWQDSMAGITTDEEGNILTAATGYNEVDTVYICLWRYNEDGSPDVTFGTDGFAFSALSPHYHYALDIVTHPDGRILVTGFTSDLSAYTMALWCFNADGTPDTDFGTDGLVTTGGTAGGEDDQGCAVTVDQDGKILVAGASENAASKTDMIVWRFNSDGSPDTTFNTTGYVTYNNGIYSLGAYDILVDDDGDIFVTGYSSDSVIVLKYEADGTPDTTFGTDGALLYDDGSGDCEGYGMALDGSGRILVTGYTDLAYDFFVVWRFSEDGSLDTSFGTGGAAYGPEGWAQGIGVDAGGRIVVVGTDYSGTDDDAAVCRFYEDGSPDTTFGTGGTVTLESTGDDYGNSMNISDEGRIFIRSTKGDNSSMSIWCLE